MKSNSLFDTEFLYNSGDIAEIALRDKIIFNFEAAKFYPKNINKLTFIIMGAKKISDNFDYKAAIEGIYRNLKQFRYTEKIFILGHDYDIALKHIKSPFDRIIAAKNPDDVIFSSFKQALYVVSPKSEWVVMLFLRDFDKDISFVKHAISTAKRDIIVPTHNGHPSHPLIFRRAIIERLKKVRKELGIPYILRKFESQSEYFAV